MVQGKIEGKIQYKLVNEEGPDHRKSFTVEVYVGNDLYGIGVGHTKKAAEMQAAYHAILKLQEK